MKKTGVLLITVVLLLIPIQSGAMLEVGIGVWEEDIRGDLSYSLFNAVADVVDLKHDLDLERDVRGIGYLKLELPIVPSLYLGFTPMRFKGTGSQDNPFVFGRYTFLADEDLETTVVLHHFDIGLYYSVEVPDLALLKKVKVDLGVNLRTAELDVEITGTVATNTGDRRRRESENYTLPIPMLYGAVQITPVEKISVEFEGRGVSFGGDHLVSMLGKIKFRVHKGLFVAAGYRYDYIRLDEDDLNVDSTVSGIFCETGFEF